MKILGERQIVSGAKLDFAVELTDFLGVRTISSAVWATISGLTLVGASSISGNTRAIARYTSTNVGAVYLPNFTAVLNTGDEVIFGFRLQVVARIVLDIILSRVVGEKFTLGATDWSPYLDGDTISSRSWSVDSGLTILSGGTTATPKIEATAAGVWYATEHIITASGQEDERSIAVAVRSL